MLLNLIFLQHFESMMGVNVSNERIKEKLGGCRPDSGNKLSLNTLSVNTFEKPPKDRSYYFMIYLCLELKVIKLRYSIDGRCNFSLAPTS